MLDRILQEVTQDPFPPNSPPTNTFQTEPNSDTDKDVPLGEPRYDTDSDDNTDSQKIWDSLYVSDSDTECDTQVPQHPTLPHRHQVPAPTQAPLESQRDPSRHVDTPGLPPAAQHYLSQHSQSTLIPSQIIRRTTLEEKPMASITNNTNQEQDNHLHWRYTVTAETTKHHSTVLPERQWHFPGNTWHMGDKLP